MKLIKFKHLKTGEEVVKKVKLLDDKFNNPKSDKMVVWSYTDDCIMDIEKNTIISIDPYKENKK